MTPGTFAFRLMAVTLSLTLAGCIFFETPRQRAMRNDPNFKAGYSDGCASANARGTNFRGDTVRDDAAYQVSQAYRPGWTAGLTTCNNQFNRNPNPNTSKARPGPGSEPADVARHARDLVLFGVLVFSLRRCSRPGQADPCRALAVERARRSAAGTGVGADPRRDGQLSTGACASDLLDSWGERLTHYLR